VDEGERKSSEEKAGRAPAAPFTFPVFFLPFPLRLLL
jgi:hypothetical protein